MTRRVNRILIYLRSQDCEHCRAPEWRAGVEATLERIKDLAGEVNDQPVLKIWLSRDEEEFPACPWGIELFPTLCGQSIDVDPIDLIPARVVAALRNVCESYLLACDRIEAAMSGGAL
jgi:hypothetical protein